MSRFNKKKNETEMITKTNIFIVIIEMANHQKRKIKHSKQQQKV